MTFNANVNQSIKANQTNPLDISEAVYPVNFSTINALAEGVGANQANQIFTDERTLAPSATEDLDLSGVLVDAFGATLLFTRIKAILIEAVAANTNDVQVTREATNGVPLFIAAGDGIALTPGASFSAVFPDATGVTVTAGTGDLLTITNSAGGTSVTYKIIIVGTI